MEPLRRTDSRRRWEPLRYLGSWWRLSWPPVGMWNGFQAHAPLGWELDGGVLYSFCQLANCADGLEPYGGLIFDGAGNLYGTTATGGASGGGVVFKLTPNSDGSWTETVLQ